MQGKGPDNRTIMKRKEQTQVETRKREEMKEDGLELKRGEGSRWKNKRNETARVGVKCKIRKEEQRNERTETKNITAAHDTERTTRRYTHTHTHTHTHSIMNLKDYFDDVDIFGGQMNEETVRAMSSFTVTANCNTNKN